MEYSDLPRTTEIWDVGAPGRPKRCHGAWHLQSSTRGAGKHELLTNLSPADPRAPPSLESDRNCPTHEPNLGERGPKRVASPASFVRVRLTSSSATFGEKVKASSPARASSTCATPGGRAQARAWSSSAVTWSKPAGLRSKSIHTHCFTRPKWVRFMSKHTWPNTARVWSRRPTLVELERNIQSKSGQNWSSSTKLGPKLLDFVPNVVQLGAEVG